MSKDTDHLGRPVVVITGMGVMTSLGQGQADNWKALTSGISGIRRISRFPTEGLRTTIAGTVDFIPVEAMSAPALSQRMAELVIEEAVAEAGIGRIGRLSRPTVPGVAADRDRVDTAPCPGRGVGRERSCHL